MKKRNTMILIPTLNPSPSLVQYVQDLIASGFDKILIVNDGSDIADYDETFKKIASFSQCTILNHAVNLGKGRALKNGFNYFLNTYQYDTNVKGIITADSDGQHRIEDIIKLDDYFCELPSKDGLILGVRSFKHNFVPFKSKFGNTLTNGLFHILFGRKISDTQTGLRGIPRSLIREYIELKGERFEFETNQLIESVSKHIPFYEIGIETIYINDNSETHFDPIKDSIAIYTLLFSSFFKFIVSSLSSSIVDLVLFQVLLMLMTIFPDIQKIWMATIGARLCSSLFNYAINKSIVFHNDTSHRSTLAKYYLLCIIQMCCSATGVALLSGILPFQKVIVKIVVDTVLFCISYQIQRKFVFGQEHV